MKNIIYKGIFCLSICLFLFNSSFAQEENTSANFEIGLEVQVYPTGIIPGLRIEKFLDQKSSLGFRLGYQLIDHRDLGVHQDETGSGFGGSISYRRFFSSIDKGFSLGIRTDVWKNTIDWSDDTVSGTTKITVLQPTLVGEYTYKASDNFVITPSLSFGFEWNVVTDGEPTGQGAILLVGCTFGFRK